MESLYLPQQFGANVYGWLQCKLEFCHNLFQERKGKELSDFLNIFCKFFQYELTVVCMLFMEDLKREQKNLDGILAISAFSVANFS